MHPLTLSVVLVTVMGAAPAQSEPISAWQGTGGTQAGTTGSQTSPQTPPPQQQPPAPRTTRPAARAQATRLAIDIEVTDEAGAPLAGVVVRASGPVDREASTGKDGTLRLINLRAGTYRLHFEHDGFVSFEREVTLIAGARAATALDVVLNAAPTPAQSEPPPTRPVPRVPEVTRPVGQSKTLDVTSFIESNFIGRNEPQKVSLLGCTGYATTRLLQIREPLDRRTHEEADETIFVVAGEATVRLGDREQSLEPNGLVIIPRGTEYSVARRGRNPAILLSVVSGPPCNEEK